MLTGKSNFMVLFSDNLVIIKIINTLKKGENEKISNHWNSDYNIFMHIISFSSQ